MKLFKKRKVDPEVQAAYDEAYKRERMKVAAERGAAKAREKPFYQKLGGAAEGLFKGISASASGSGKAKGKSRGVGDMMEFFIGSPDKPKRKRRKRKRRR